MQSEQVSQSTTTSIQNPLSTPQNNGSPETPLEFISRSVAEITANLSDHVVHKNGKPVEQVVQAVPQAPSPLPVVEAKEENPYVPEVEGAQSAEPSATNPEEDVDSEPEMQIDPDKTQGVPLTQNYKLLKSKFKETKQNLKQLQAERTTLTKELDDYKTGAAMPEVVNGMEARIAELEHYEKIHNLKASKEYQTAIVKPITDKETALKALFKDYGVPEEHSTPLLNSLLSETNQAKLNEKLYDHFGNVGAIEAKQMLSSLRDLHGKAQEADKTPAQMLEQMRQEQSAINAVRDAERKVKIQSTAKDSWTRSLMQIREEGKALELIMKPNDPEFNKNFVVPVLTAASREYGKVISMLAEHGLTELDPDLAYALANMAQKAHASAVAIESRNAAMTHAEELERNVERSSGFHRPLSASGQGAGGNGGGQKAPVEMTPAKAAEQILAKVMGGR